MIPTVLLIGLIVGRWWVVPLAGLGWSALLLIHGSCDLGCSPGALVLGMANAAVAVMVRKVIGRLVGLVASRFARAS